LYANYIFEEKNPYLNLQTAFEDGLAALSEGRLGEGQFFFFFFFLLFLACFLFFFVIYSKNQFLAIQLFEAAVQQDPQNADAWEKLGLSQVRIQQNKKNKKIQFNSK